MMMDDEEITRGIIMSLEEKFKPSIESYMSSLNDVDIK